MKWILATESPKESGLYLVIKKDGTGQYRKEVDSLYYSRQYDAWNAFDGLGADNAIPDIRNREGLREYESYVYAWAEYKVNPEEMDALEKGGGVMRYTNDPVADAERYTAEMEAATEARRHRRVVKCTATLWLTVDHATEAEALQEAEEFFREMFAGADDYDSKLEEEYA